MRTIIIGNGVAGLTVARMVRAQDKEMDIDIFAREPYPYYSRIRLIEFLAGELGQAELFFYKPDWYEKQAIAVHENDPVQQVNPAAHTVRTASGREEAFDFLVIASGSHSFIPPIEHSDLPGFFTLRTLDDAIHIRRYAAGAKTAVVVGGGLLGLESAYSLKKLGLDVMVLEFSDRLLPRQLDEQGAAVLREVLAQRGLKISLSVAIKACMGEKRVTGVQTTDGRLLPADLVLISAGVRPETDYLTGSGITVDQGVVVNDRLETNFPYIYAVGDVAQWREPIWGIVPAVLNQAPVVAANILGMDRLYSGTQPATNLKVAGVDMAVFGQPLLHGERCQEVVLPGKGDGSYLKLLLYNQRVAGAIAIGHKQIEKKLSKLVQEHILMSAPEARQFLAGG